MAKGALHKCNKIGCCALTYNRFCTKHETERSDYDSTRKSASERGYNGRWRKAREGFLASNPFCKRCLDEGIYEPATVVDHIIPHKGDNKLFWDRNNWQPLCKSCHDRKTATEDGGGWTRRG